MKKYSNFAIVISFFGLWITSIFSMEKQIFLGFSFIMSFGILHGANDLLIIKNLNTDTKSKNFTKLLLQYLLTVFSGGLLFFIAPSLILLFFILISGYHFGEQQLNYLSKNKDKIITQISQLLYGLLILFLLFTFNKNEVCTVINEITNRKFDKEFISYSLYVIIISFSICFIYLFKKNNQLRSKLLFELFYLIVFTILFKVASLIWGFAIYFIVWHSIPSIIDQVKFLYGDFNKINFIYYFKSAVLYWILSLIGLSIFYFVFSNEKLFNSLFFSFLAAITFPHVLVMLKMFYKNG